MRERMPIESFNFNPVEYFKEWERIHGTNPDLVTAWATETDPARKQELQELIWEWKMWNAQAVGYEKGRQSKS